MGATSSRAFWLLIAEATEWEDPQTMGAGAPGLLAALAEHGNGQDAHTMGAGAPTVGGHRQDSSHARAPVGGTRGPVSTAPVEEI